MYTFFFKMFFSITVCHRIVSIVLCGYDIFPSLISPGLAVMQNFWCCYSTYRRGITTLGGSEG